MDAGITNAEPAPCNRSGKDQHPKTLEPDIPLSHQGRTGPGRVERPALRPERSAMRPAATTNVASEMEYALSTQAVEVRLVPKSSLMPSRASGCRVASMVMRHTAPMLTQKTAQ